jgi:hypothetical protein
MAEPVTADDRRREQRLRSRAARQGLRLHKSRTQREHLDDLGGYMLVDANMNTVVSGSSFELDLDDVEAYLSS